MILYKLTTSDCKSKYGDVVWTEGVTVTIPGAERRTTLCASGLLHAYPNPNLALLLDPIDAEYGCNAILWEGKSVV